MQRHVAFNFFTPEYKNKFVHILRKIRGDYVRVEYLTSGNLTLKRVTYTSASGRIKPQKLYRYIAKGTTVLADERVNLPDGIIRFCNSRFSERLCVSCALDNIRKMDDPSGLKLGIYDPDGNSAEFLYDALRLCRSPVTVTYNLLPYDRVRSRALRELGAAAVITRNSNELKDCDLIVAPTRISAYIPVKSSAILLTAGKPYVRLGGKITCCYDITLPPELEAIRPPELSREYFASAFFRDLK